jgi:hypothetical protein
VKNRDTASAFFSPMARAQSCVALRMAASSLAMFMDTSFQGTAPVLGTRNGVSGFHVIGARNPKRPVPT